MTLPTVTPQTAMLMLTVAATVTVTVAVTVATVTVACAGGGVMRSSRALLWPGAVPVRSLQWKLRGVAGGGMPEDRAGMGAGAK